MSEGSTKPLDPTGLAGKLEAGRVTVVYTMYHHLGDFVVMGGLLKKFDQLQAGFESVVAHRHSPHVGLFAGNPADRFFDVATVDGFLNLCGKLRRQRREGRIVLGVPMAPGSIQAHLFFQVLKKLGALSYIVDFNLNNADIITPPRRRYIFDRHLAQAAEIFKRPDWLDDTSLPLAVAEPRIAGRKPGRRIGLFPWSGRRHLPEFRWPDARWLDLTKRLLETSEGEIVLLGKDDDFARFAQTLRAGLPENLRNRFLDRPAGSVPDLVASLREVDGLITLNTAALHLAHAIQLPAVALCGSSLECWLPEAPHIRLVRDERGILPPSDKYGHDPLQPSLQNIDVGEVHRAAVEHFLK
jgi:Glycosyltransferase family 9 (heptosyltransferase)